MPVRRDRNHRLRMHRGPAGQEVRGAIFPRSRSPHLRMYRGLTGTEDSAPMVRRARNQCLRTDPGMGLILRGQRTRLIMLLRILRILRKRWIPDRIREEKTQSCRLPESDPQEGLSPRGKGGSRAALRFTGEVCRMSCPIWARAFRNAFCA